jgi:L-ascorbate metabolism protein UlaG (beta-lactamase superfamily)
VRWQYTKPWRTPRAAPIVAAVPNPFARKPRKKSEIKKSPKPQGEAIAGGEAAAAARKIGLKPQKDWHKRNFFTEVLIPSMFEKRSGQHEKAEFPELRDGEICVTWIGHASFLIQTQGQNLLIDPNWARWLKVIKRVRHPGLALHELPNIDLVLVTHAHFDHLDRKTLRRIASDQPIVVPFEVGNLVHDLGFHTVHELHHWETHEHGPLRITFTPAHHWGARVLHDSHRGFGGFVIEAAGRTIYHCGDTAFFEGFGEIGRRHPIDVALLPIGAYDPPSGREVHMNPEEALDAFVALGAKRMVPMHYGSFRLSYEPLHEPPERLMYYAREKGLDDRIVVMREGVPMIF